MKFKTFVITAFLFIFCGVAKAEITVKSFKIKTEKNINYGNLQNGKIWINEAEKKIFHYNKDEIKVYTTNNGVLSLLGKNTLPLESDKISAIKKTVNLKIKTDRPESISGSYDGKVLYIGDSYGTVSFVDIHKRIVLGTLRFLKKPIKLTKPMKDGSLLVFYDEGEVSYIKKDIMPYVSIFQDFKSLYVNYKTKSVLPSDFGMVQLNENCDKFVIVTSKKNIMLYDTATLELIKTIKATGYVNFIGFIGDDLIYGVSNQKDLSLNPYETDINNRLSRFYDWKKEAITSEKNKFFVKISDEGKFVVYYENQLVGILDEESKNILEIIFGKNGSTIFAVNRNKDRIAVYQLKH